MHNPYNYHVAVRDDAMFFGREKMLDRLVNGLSAPLPLSAAIFGGQRCGVTSFLSKLVRMLSRDIWAAGKRRFLPCNLDLQRRRPLLTCSDDFFLWVLEELGETWEMRQELERGMVVDVLQTCYRSEVARGPVDAFVRAFRSLDTHSERIRLVILIDESDRILTAEWGDDLRPNLRALLSNSPIVEDVALVMAGSMRMYTKVTENGSPLENILDRYPLPTLSHEATLALARRPNDNRISEEAAEEVWRQTGGHPCMAQYILHELWDELEGELAGELADATVGDVQDIAETFDDRTRHFSTWTETLGRPGHDVYRFLAEQDAPVSYPAIRQRFSEMPSTSLRSTVDALLYHGLIHCYGRGRRRRYEIAGQMYRDWFTSAGKLGMTEQPETVQTLTEAQIVAQGDYVAGDKPTGVDQRGQEVHGPQTNVAGDVSGPVLSGAFQGPVATGGGEAVDLRGTQGAVYKPAGPVEQQFGDRITITGDGNVVGDGSSSRVVKTEVGGAVKDSTIITTTGNVVVVPRPGELLDLAPSPEATRLHRILKTRLDLGEFRTLCFDLGVNHDALGGEGLSGKARQLVLFLQKRNALPTLVEWLRRERPDIAMNDEQ